MFVSELYASNNQSRELGIEFENYIHNIITSCKNNIVMNEREIVQKYGKLAYAIDHLIIHNNFIIAIQDKWKKGKQSLHDAVYFNSSIDIIISKENKKVIGIYLSKNGITSGAIECFKLNIEKSNGMKKYHSINADSFDIIERSLKKLLYKYYIFMYDDEDNAIMFF